MIDVTIPKLEFDESFIIVLTCIVAAAQIAHVQKSFKN